MAWRTSSSSKRRAYPAAGPEDSRPKAVPASWSSTSWSSRTACKLEFDKLQNSEASREGKTYKVVFQRDPRAAVGAGTGVMVSFPGEVLLRTGPSLQSKIAGSLCVNDLVTFTKTSPVMQEHWDTHRHISACIIRQEVRCINPVLAEKGPLWMTVYQEILSMGSDGGKEWWVQEEEEEEEEEEEDPSSWIEVDMPFQ